MIMFRLSIFAKRMSRSVTSRYFRGLPSLLMPYIAARILAAARHHPEARPDQATRQVKILLACGKQIQRNRHIRFTIVATVTMPVIAVIHQVYLSIWLVCLS
jgi:hypothetical protein